MKDRSPSSGYLWKLRPYYRQLKGLLIIGSISGVAMNIFVVLPPLLLGHAINVALDAERGTATPSDVGLAALLFVAGTAATEVPRIGKRYWLGVARTRFVASVRADALRGVLEWPSERTTTIPVGDVMARIIGDVGILGTGVGEIMVETWDTLLFSLSLIVTMIVLSPGLALLALMPVPLALIVAQRSGLAVAKRTRQARESESSLTTALREQIGALRLIRLFGRVGATIRQVDDLAEVQARSELNVIRLDEALGATYSVVLAAGVVVVLWLGGTRVVQGGWSVGALVAFLALFFRFVNRAPRIPMMVNRVQAGGAAFHRLRPLLAPALDVRGEPRWWTFGSTNIPGSLVMSDHLPSRSSGLTSLSMHQVSFTYPGSGHPSLEGVNFSMAPGSLVAVTGPVASGKSTLARLAAGLVTPSGGQVLIDGLAPSNISADERAATIGYLGQEPHLFSGTVADNIAMWASDDAQYPSPELLAAVSLAALEHDLTLLPEGITTQIGELGVRISGGQRQRIGLARALSAQGRCPGLLVLDDPFSAADVHTEAEIISGLRQALGPTAPRERRSTVLLVSHRLAAFPLADLILVLDRGRIVEQGTHGELLAANGLYARISRAQAVLDSTTLVSGEES
ncbi:MAG: ABC transporter ATP-binding protein [Acidimicrobiales bacterium]